MTHLEQSREPEMLLDQWLKEPDRDRARALLDTLIGSFAEPVVRRIVTFKLASGRSTGEGGIQPADVDDVCGTALYNLLARLDRLKHAGIDSTVRNFSGYAAVTAYNACNEYFRAKRPAWLSLSMKVRYLITHSPKFAIWEVGEGQEVCGFARDLGRPPLSNPSAFSEASAKVRRSVDPSRLTLGELVEMILNAARSPMVFEDLVDAAAEWSGIRETRLRSLDEDPEHAGRFDQLADSRPAADTSLIDRHYMQRLWTEICQLSLEHRKALLLNLNDSAGGDIQLFVWLGVTDLRQIANALEMDPLAFAELWKELPLDDTRIARDLGLSRQDVANRRSAARKRLARRMKELGSEK